MVGASGIVTFADVLARAIAPRRSVTDTSKTMEPCDPGPAGSVVCEFTKCEGKTKLNRLQELVLHVVLCGTMRTTQGRTDVAEGSWKPEVMDINAPLAETDENR